MRVWFRDRKLGSTSVISYLGAGLGAVHDGVTAVQREGVLQLGQTLLRELVSGINHPSVGLGTEKTLLEPLHREPHGLHRDGGTSKS